MNIIMVSYFIPCNHRTPYGDFVIKMSNIYMVFYISLQVTCLAETYSGFSMEMKFSLFRQEMLTMLMGKQNMKFSSKIKIVTSSVIKYLNRKDV